MAEATGGGRHSKALAADLIADEDEKARREAQNGLAQFDAGLRIIKTHLDRGQSPAAAPFAIARAGGSVFSPVGMTACYRGRA